jgi:hypothetical protein
MTVRTETGVRSLTMGRVPTGTWPAVLLDQRSAAEGMVGIGMTCVTSFVTELHTSE